MSLPPPGRLDLHVVARFLDRLAEPGPWTRSRLQRAVGVNYDVFRRYLAVLQERGHVEPAPGAEPAVRLTPSGERVRRELLEWLRATFGAMRF